LTHDRRFAIAKSDGKRTMMPILGFGTSELNGEVATRMVKDAIAIGYRHIDTAPIYGNEQEVGEAVRASGVPRNDIFLTTKIWIDSFNTDDLQRSVETSLERIGTDVLDLVLLHWPNPKVPLDQTIKALNLVKSRGLTKHIGVSNFTVELISRAVAYSNEPLLANQVEYHPFLNQRRLLEKVRAHGMTLIAHTPLARGAVSRDPVICAIAELRGRSAGQIALRWLIQQSGVAAIPRSKSLERAYANFNVFDFELSGEEMDRIYALSRPDGRILNWAGFAPKWD
jgi:diketogulonate reductase-like aldo/keto reductase